MTFEVIDQEQKHQPEPAESKGKYSDIIEAMLCSKFMELRSDKALGPALSPKEAALYLGLNGGRVKDPLCTLGYLRRKGKLKYSIVARKVVYPIAYLDEYLRKNSRPRVARRGRNKRA